MLKQESSLTQEFSIINSRFPEISNEFEMSFGQFQKCLEPAL